jgi:hypothetical protein
LAARPAKSVELSPSRDKADAGDDGEEPEQPLVGWCFAEEQECADGGKQGRGAAGNGVDHGEISHLITALEAEAVGEVDQPAEQEAAEDGCAPCHCALSEEPHDPRRIRHAGNEVVRENEGWPGCCCLLREQVPGGVNERSEDNKSDSGERHETSGRRGALG